MTEYVSCPNCSGALLSKQYKERFGQCWTCYERKNVPLGVRIDRAL